MAKLNKTGSVKMLVRIEESPYYGGSRIGHVSLETMRLADDATVSPFSFKLADDDKALEHMTVTAQFDDDTTFRPTPILYATRVTFPSIDSREQAEGAVKAYKAIDRSCDTLRERFGQSFIYDFRGYLIAICEGLGITEVGIESPYHADGYRWESPATAAETIEHKVQRFWTEKERRQTA